MRVISNIESIKKRTAKEQDGEWFKNSLLIIALVLSLMFFATERMLWSKLKYELAQAEIFQQELNQVHRRLKLEKASLENPARLAREGRKLGLRPPREEQIVPIETR